MIKIIATDMDGTLLNSKGEISEEFFEIFPKIIEKNKLLNFIDKLGR